MKKGSEIPEGYIACAIKGRLVNLSKSDVFEIDKIVRNKRYVWNYFLSMNIVKYKREKKVYILQRYGQYTCSVAPN